MNTDELIWSSVLEKLKFEKLLTSRDEKMAKTGDWGLLKIDKETKPISNVLYQIIPCPHSMRLSKAASRLSEIFI